MLIKLGVQNMNGKATKENSDNAEEQRIKDHYNSIDVPDPDDPWIEEDVPQSGEPD
jgi:hypothetical protein